MFTIKSKSREWTVQEIDLSVGFFLTVMEAMKPDELLKAYKDNDKAEITIAMLKSYREWFTLLHMLFPDMAADEFVTISAADLGQFLTDVLFYTLGAVAGLSEKKTATKKQ